MFPNKLTRVQSDAPRGVGIKRGQWKHKQTGRHDPQFSKRVFVSPMIHRC